jgi:hypothetical protein
MRQLLRGAGALTALMLALSCAQVALLAEENCSDGQDEDEDGATDCLDTDCDGDPSCAAEREVCDNGIDDDGDLGADCQDADCAQAANCLFELNCSDGRDDDVDGAIDCADSECAESPDCQGVCDPANDLCPDNDICIVDQCEPAFGRSYFFSGFELALGPEDQGGGGWDPFGGSPDPKVELHLNGAKFFETGTRNDTFDAAFNETVSATLNEGDVLEVRVLDSDADADDIALQCFADPVPADLLRFRAVQCSNVNGNGNVVGIIGFFIDPN